VRPIPAIINKTAPNEDKTFILHIDIIYHYAVEPEGFVVAKEKGRVH